MKEKQKVTTILELKDHAGYATSKSKLGQLETFRAEAVGEVKRIKFTAGRESRELQRYISQGRCYTGQASEASLDRTALRVIANGVTSALMTEARIDAIKPKFSVESDVDAAVEYDEAETRALLFERAITIQKREVARQKNLAIAEIVNSACGERETKARVLADALLQFAAALREEFEFVNRLRMQDDAIPGLLSPRPFPFEIPSDPAVLQWIADAMAVSPMQAETWLKNPAASQSAHS